MLALIGVALPAALPSSRTTLGSGSLEPYPSAPVVSWEVSPAIAGRGTTFVTFGPLTIDPGGGPEYSDPRHEAVVGAVQAGSTISDLFALDVHDGSVSWLAPYAGLGRYRGCADSLLSGAMVCVGQGGTAGAAELFALRVSDGRELVRWDAPGWARSVALTGDGVVLAGASPDGAELLVPGMTGAFIPTLGMAGDSAPILIGTDVVTAYSTTGALRWLVPDPPAFIEEVLGSDGRRIVVVRRHSVQEVRDLAAIDAATGETVWSIAVAPDQLVATAGGRLILVSPTSIRGLAPTGS